MYESPINIMLTQLRAKQEDEAFRITQSVAQGMGINIDKEELIKALQFDRGQYEKGYKDGVKALAERFRALLSEYSAYDTLHTYEILDRIDVAEEELVGEE